MEDQHEEGTTLPVRTYKALETVDNMPPALRELVHDFSFNMVNNFVSAGITKPSMIRSLILNVMTGPRSSSINRVGFGPREFRGSPVAAHIDNALTAAGSTLGFRGVLALLDAYGMTIVPKEPSQPMVEASIAETAKHGLMSKETKHKVRLKAAIAASTKSLWPWMDKTK